MLALRSAGGVRIARLLQLISSGAPWQAFPTLRSASSCAKEPAYLLKLSKLPALQFVVIVVPLGVNNSLQPLIISAALAVLLFRSSADNGKLSPKVSGPYQGLPGAALLRSGCAT